MVGIKIKFVYVKNLLVIIDFLDIFFRLFCVRYIFISGRICNLERDRKEKDVLLGAFGKLYMLIVFIGIV